MTVIVTLINQHCTVHATDSFITVPQPDGKLKVYEAKQTKTVPVQSFRGAMSYWGLARLGDSWSALEWLRKQSEEAKKYRRPEDFAMDLRDKLNRLLDQFFPLEKPISAGIGIHFTAYERISDYWIPELFVLSNFSDPTYQKLHVYGIGLSRHTYHTAHNADSELGHRESRYRLKVHEYLERGGMLWYNNGDPRMFNPAGSLILGQMNVIKERGDLVNSDDISTYRRMARLPIEFISKVQEEFVCSGKRRVGGKSHDLSITPNGEYVSDTGDAP